MANTLGITERTLAQLADATNSINVVGGADGRSSVFQPLTCRATDHTADDGGSADVVDGMAIFKSSRHGEPWVKEDSSLERITASAGQGATLTLTETGGVVDGVTITNGGSGYLDVPAVTITGGGTNASITLSIAGGVVTGATIVAGGTGYTTPLGAVATVIPTNVTRLIPSFDYGTFG